jgi:serine/threonine-protein kinase
MLTGRQAFAAGESVSDTIAAILTAEPDMAALPAEIPQVVRRLLAECLVKDSRRRLSHIAIAKYLVGHAMNGGEAPRPRDETRANRRRPLLLATVALLLGAAAASASTWWVLRNRQVIRPELPVRFTVTATTNGETWRSLTDRPIALSPDGRTLVYRGSAGAGERPRLFVRSVAALDPRPLTSAELPRSPFFSPDSEWIGFFAGDTGGELRKVRVSGGPALTICTCAPRGSLPAGASWGDDDTIVFALAQPTSTEATPGLFVVPAGGGEPKVLTTLDPAKGEGGHAYPFVLPGSRGVLYRQAVPGRSPSEGRIMLLDRASGVRREIAPAGSAAEYVRGHLVYADGSGRLNAIPFDLSRLEPTGPATPLPEQVQLPTVGPPLFSTAASGGLAFVAPAEAGAAEMMRSLFWVTRQGREEPIPAPARAYAVARLSADAGSIALDIRDQENDIWIWSIVRRTLTRLTTGRTLDQAPVWTPDGRRIIWSSTRDSTNPTFYWQAADGTGTPQRLGGFGLAQFPTAVTPDGRYLLFNTTGGAASMQRMSLSGSPTIEPVISGMGPAINGDLSPDGKWLAYESNESGQYEVYARPYPNVDAGRWQLSSQGGTRPVWARSGRELFFLDATEHLSVVPVAVSGDRLVPSAPRRVLENAYYPGFTARGFPLRGYDVSPDGERFLMIKGASEYAASQSIVTMALNWSPVP